VVLLHGAGSHSATMIPILLALRHKGYRNVANVAYDCSGTLAKSVAIVAGKLKSLGGVNAATPLIVIGHSLGGVIGYELQAAAAALHFNIVHLVAIASPVHGSIVAKWANDTLPRRKVSVCPRARWRASGLPSV
jgi:pimeloyl-ACP methyl ester carboxylesterase